MAFGLVDVEGSDVGLPLREDERLELCDFFFFGALAAAFVVPSPCIRTECPEAVPDSLGTRS